jgi:predicted MFS family arabinose efflux permease
VLPLGDARWPLAALVVLSGLAFGGFWVPAMSLLSRGAEAARLDQSFAFAFMNLAWAAGQGTGSSVGGALGERLGDVVPYLVGTALCLVTLAAVSRARVTRTAAGDVGVA